MANFGLSVIATTAKYGLVLPLHAMEAIAPFLETSSGHVLLAPGIGEVSALEPVVTSLIKRWPLNFSRACTWTQWLLHHLI